MDKEREEWEREKDKERTRSGGSEKGDGREGK